MAFVLYYFLCSFFPCRRLLVPVLCGSQLLWVLSFVLFFGLPLLLDRCASGLRCLVPTLAAMFVQPQQPLVVGFPSAVTVCLAPALAVQGVSSQSFVTSCCSCLLNSLGVSAAAFCPLGLLLHPVLLLFLAWVSSFGVYSGLGLRCCGPGYGSSLLFLRGGGGGGGSLSLVLVFLAWLLQLFCFVQVTWVSWTICWGFLLSTSSVAGSSGWFALALRFSLDGFMVRTRYPSIS